MRRNLVILLLVQALALAAVLAGADGLPLRVAAHFTADGRADGWQSRSGYLTTIILLQILLPLAIVLPTLFIGRLPPAMIGLPNRDWWLAPERRAASLDWLAGHLCLMGLPLALGVLGIHLSVVWANRQDPPQLSGSAAGLVIATILLGEAGLVLGLFRRFGKPAAR